MKILIVTEVFAGKGHEKAAKSIAKAIKNIDPSHDVLIVPLLSVINPPLEYILQTIYMGMISKYPELWGWLHNKEVKFKWFKSAVAYYFMMKTNKYLKIEQPDLIIATHASGIGALAKLKERYPYHLAAVFTDFQINSFWVDKNMDYYFVAHDVFKNQLIQKYHIEEQKIFVTGIPIDPIFAVNEKKKEIQPDFRILIMGGGLGLGGIKEVILSLAKLKEIPILLHVVAGSNEKLYQELQWIKTEYGIHMTIDGYVEDVFSLMKKADLLISKAGGLTISEALSIPIPILIYKPLPGQEEKNAGFLIRHKAAIRIKDSLHIPYWVEYLYHHPKLYHNLQEYADRLGKANSSIQISETLFKHLTSQKEKSLRS